jgi:hypothetical protein
VQLHRKIVVSLLKSAFRDGSLKRHILCKLCRYKAENVERKMPALSLRAHLNIILVGLNGYCQLLIAFLIVRFSHMQHSAVRRSLSSDDS